MEFISINKVINSISKCIELPDNIPLWAQRAYRESYAAAKLDQQLQNSPDTCPKTYDVRPTGLYRYNEAAYAEMSSILVHMSQWYFRACQSLDGEDGPVIDKYARKLIYAPHNKDGQFKDISHADRYEEIGFKLAEIVVFLQSNKISNDLAKSSEIVNKDKIDDSADKDKTCLAISEKAVTEPKRHIYTSDKKERLNELDSLIDKAIKNATGDSVADIFMALKKMALDEEGPFTGTVDGGLQYTNSKNEPATLTKSSLDNRLRRRRNKARSDTP